MLNGSSHLFHKLTPSAFISPSQQPQIGIFHFYMEEFHCGRQVRHMPGLVWIPSIDHILPHQHSQAVTVIVPPLRFNLQMLSEHIESQIFHCLNIVDHRLITRRCIQPLRPISLIQYPFLKIRLVIQKYSWNSFRISCHTNLSHGSVASHMIQSHLHFYII